MPVSNQAIIVIQINTKSASAVKGLNQTQKAIRGVQKTGKSASSVLNQFGAAMNIAFAPITNFGVALRQIGQALQGVSFLATAFISIPMVAAIKAMSEEAIKFDAALIKAQKTTELLDSEIGRLANTSGTLSGELRTLAQSVATPLEVLADLAAQAGQLGVRGVSNIMKFVRVAEILGQTTDIAPQEALLTFGRLATALGIESERAGTYILQLANAINKLENTSTASAANIAQAMLNAISAASGFRIAGADLAGFMTALYEAGIDAREAGTSFSRVAQYVASNIEDLSAMTNRTIAELQNAFDKDFVGGLTSVIQAIGQVESRTRQMAIASEIFGVRAARGIVLLANNYENLLIPTLQDARKEFNQGTSLIDEYVKSMQSTQAQIGILKNNLRVLGVTMGDTFLPIINTILKYFVPAVQMAIEGFSNLSRKTRMMILAGAAFLAILGPLTMILGTLAFSIGIAITGIVNLITFFGSLGSAVVPLVGIITKVGLALVGLAVFAEDAMVSVRDTILSYADQARSWGNNLIGSLAAGMLTGIAYVINAAIAIGNVIARFFAAFSPPKSGALRDIMKWGANLINTYIQGFMHADFSAIDDVTGMIGRYFRSLGRLERIDEGAIVSNILGVRHAFVQLLDVFKRTGEISDSILDNISSQMGAIGDEVATFLRLQLKVNSAQEVYDKAVARLREIRDLREDINKTYSKEES
jgi:TP901 family phage tail tape measure protein